MDEFISIFLYEATDTYSSVRTLTALYHHAAGREAIEWVYRAGGRDYYEWRATRLLLHQLICGTVNLIN